MLPVLQSLKNDLFEHFEPFLAHFRLLSPLQRANMAHFHSSTHIPIYFACFVIFVVYLHKKLSKFTQLGLFLHMYEVFSKYYEVKNVLQRSKYLSEWKIMIIFHVTDRNCKLNCFFDRFKHQKMIILI